MKRLNALPKEIQDYVKNTLRAYDLVDVWFEDGRYTYGTVIKSKYPPDSEYIGTYHADDVYSREERIVNYCEEFHCYPREYKGKRDYDLIKDHKAKYKMIDGNIVRA